MILIGISLCQMLLCTFWRQQPACLSSSHRIHSANIIDALIIIAVSIYFAYVLRVSLKKLYPEYKKPPWQTSATMLALVAFFILLRIVVEYRPSPDSDRTLINLLFFFILTSLFTFVSR